MRGIVFWTAPEMAKGHGRKRYGPKVDIWSAGCVLLKMWTGGRTWQDVDMIALMLEVSPAFVSRPGVFTEIYLCRPPVKGIRLFLPT